MPVRAAEVALSLASHLIASSASLARDALPAAAAEALAAGTLRGDALVLGEVRGRLCGSSAASTLPRCRHVPPLAPHAAHLQDVGPPGVQALLLRKYRAFLGMLRKLPQQWTQLPVRVRLHACSSSRACDRPGPLRRIRLRIASPSPSRSCCAPCLRCACCALSALRRTRPTVARRLRTCKRRGPRKRSSAPRWPWIRPAFSQR